MSVMNRQRSSRPLLILLLLLLLSLGCATFRSAIGTPVATPVDYTPAPTLPTVTPFQSATFTATPSQTFTPSLNPSQESTEELSAPPATAEATAEPDDEATATPSRSRTPRPAATSTD